MKVRTYPEFDETKRTKNYFTKYWETYNKGNLSFNGDLEQIKRRVNDRKTCNYDTVEKQPGGSFLITFKFFSSNYIYCNVSAFTPIDYRLY